MWVRGGIMIFTKCVDRELYDQLTLTLYVIH